MFSAVRWIVLILLIAAGALILVWNPFRPEVTPLGPTHTLTIPAAQAESIQARQATQTPVQETIQTMVQEATQTPVQNTTQAFVQEATRVPLQQTIQATSTVSGESQGESQDGEVQAAAQGGRPGRGKSRGYLTTPQELAVIRQKASQGIEPYKTNVNFVLESASETWSYVLKDIEECKDADEPAWIDNNAGVRTLYAKALAYHLAEDDRYAKEVGDILEKVMTQVKQIPLDEQGCRLRFAWGTPELVASADLIEDYWVERTCEGPLSSDFGDATIGQGSCKQLFQNWLVKLPYYVVSYSAASSQSNWGAASTNTTAYIADYLWDRPEVRLVHRNSPNVNGGKDLTFSPAEAYAHANQLMFDRVDGYGVAYGSEDSCDTLSGSKQNSQWEPVKSQITEKGIIPDDARREEYCNIPVYNGKYQNYPQLYLGHMIQQCELMLRRGDSSCYDHVNMTDVPDYTFTGPDGVVKKTHLYPGRGSIERAIQAIIIDSNTEWKHDPALAVAYRYYIQYHRLPGIERWAEQIDDADGCGQDICFGGLTHGFAPGEKLGLPPVVEPLSE